MSIEENVRPYGIIYAAVNTVTQKYYVGKTTMRLERRKATHLWHGKKRSTNRFHNSIFKHGPEAFFWFVVDYADTAEDLSLKEERWMWATNSIHPKFGYNLKTDSCGSMAGKKRSPESVAKSANARRGTHRSEECRRKISLVRKGKKWSEEQRKKFFSHPNVRNITAEQITKARVTRMARGGYGWEQFSDPDKARGRLSAALKMYHLEHPFTEEDRAKFRENKRKTHGIPVICLDTLEVFNSLAQVAEKYSPGAKCYSGLVACLKGYKQSYKKHHWQYLKEYNEQQGIAVSSSP